GRAAVSVQDRVLMKRVRDEWMKVELESCGTCHERWFDLNVENGRCSKCRHKNKPEKYQHMNAMDPGPAANLPALTQMEEMLIAPV
ncbi:hypothetical protein B0H13DRAFT_1533970, partial [Mycena leptocephala]